MLCVHPESMIYRQQFFFLKDKIKKNAN